MSHSPPHRFALAEAGAIGSPAPLSLLLVGSSAAVTETVVQVLSAADLVCRYTSLTVAEACDPERQLATYDVAIVFAATGADAGDVLQGILARLQQEDVAVPVIWVVNEIESPAAIAAMQAGVADYVRQSHLADLPAVVLRALRTAAWQQQYRQVTRCLQAQAQHAAWMNRLGQATPPSAWDDMLQNAADTLCQIFSLQGCWVWLGESEGDRRLRVASPQTGGGDRDWQRPQFPDLPPACRTQLRQGQPVRCAAWVLLPLCWQGQYRGELVLQPEPTDPVWEAIELHTIQPIGQHWAIALQQAELHAELQRREAEQTLFDCIRQTLLSSLDRSRALQLIGEYLQVDRVMLYQVSPEAIHIQAEWCPAAAEASLAGRSLTPPGWLGELTLSQNRHPPAPTTRPTATTLPPLTIHHPNLHPQFQGAVALAVPIFTGTTFYGGLEIHRLPSASTAPATAPPGFTAADEQLLRRLADHLAIALYASQHHADLEYLIRERTQQLETEKQISESANLAKSEFLAHMSHELRTPLTGIIGFSNVLNSQMQELLTPQQTKYLEGITACGQHLLDLINDLLDLSKVDAGKEELFLEPVVIQEVCDTCLNMFREAANSKALRLILHVESHLTFCIADKRRLRQILSNLLSNAVKFTETGFVRLQVSESNNLLRFAVEDSGIGIAKADQALLFHPFQQIHNHTMLAPGTGLGLTLARKLAQLHGGDITVTSELGQGSCFTLWLPHFDNFPELKHYAQQPDDFDTFPQLSCSLPQ